MKRVCLLAFLLPLLVAGDARKRQGGGEGGGDAAAFAACREGEKGFGFDSATNTYGSTCGNYPWSAESGGIDGLAATTNSYRTPTTAGGNAFTLTCSAAGVGVGSDGVTYDVATELQAGAPTDATASAGSTTNVTDGDVSMTVNAYRDQIITMTSGGCNGVSRLIESNTATVIEIQGTWDGSGGDACTGAPTGPVNTETYVIRDPLGSVCQTSGEFARINVMADLMLAQDHTRPGGRIYLPVASGQSNTLYVHRGCGRKGHGPSGTTFNGCPVLRDPNNSHFNRDIATVSGIRWVWEGRDSDGWENGRIGAWYIDDNGSGASSTVWQGIEPSNGTPNERWPLKAGADPGVPRLCAPNTSGWCQPASSGSDNRSMNKTAEQFTPFNSAVVTTASGFCANDQITVEGTCEDDPRILCAADATCDFSAGPSPNRGNLGPCQSFADLLEDEVARGGGYLSIGQEGRFYPEGDANLTGTTDHYVGRVISVSGSTCGTGANGKLFSFQSFPAPYPEFPVTGGSFTLLDWQEFYQVGGGHEGGTYSPNNWWGRDLDGSGTSNQIGDCLAAPAGNQEVLDEPVCDSAHLIASYGGFGPGFYGLTATNASSEGFGWDGSIFSYFGRARDVVYRHGRRGGWGDWSSMDVMEKIAFIENKNTSGIGVVSNFAFAGPHTVLRDFLWQGNLSIGALFGFSGAQRGASLENWTFIGNQATHAMMRLEADSTISMDDFYFDSNIGAAAAIWPSVATHNIRASHWRIIGRGNLGTLTTVGKGAISIGRANAGNEAPITGLYFSDIRMDTPEAEPCLFVLDDDPSVPEPINESRRNYSFRDVAISVTDGGGGGVGPRVFCVFETITSLKDASDSTGLSLERYVPVWESAFQNDIAIANQPYPLVAAANVPTCAAAEEGTVVHIHDDTVARGTCTDAAGVMTGGGTFRSVCKCLAGAWVPL